MKVMNVASYIALFVAVINCGAWIGASFGDDDTARSLAYGGMTLGSFALALCFQALVRYDAISQRIAQLERERETR